MLGKTRIKSILNQISKKYKNKNYYLKSYNHENFKISNIENSLQTHIIENSKAAKQDILKAVFKNELEKI